MSEANKEDMSDRGNDNFSVYYTDETIQRVKGEVAQMKKSISDIADSFDQLVDRGVADDKIIGDTAIVKTTSDNAKKYALEQWVKKRFGRVTLDTLKNFMHRLHQFMAIPNAHTALELDAEAEQALERNIIRAAAVLALNKYLHLRSTNAADALLDNLTKSMEHFGIKDFFSINTSREEVDRLMGYESRIVA